MIQKRRSPGQTAIGISLPRALLEAIDQRATALGLNRSQYLAALARRDIDERGDLTLRESLSHSGTKPASSGSKEDSGRKVFEIVKGMNRKAGASSRRESLP